MTIRPRHTGRLAGWTVLVLGLLWIAGSQAAEPVTLAWDPSLSEDVAGYRIRYGFTSGVYARTVEAGPFTEVTINLQVPGTTYHFAATAYDESGLESDPTPEITYTTRGDVPQPVEQHLETQENQPVFLPWGEAAGYTTEAVWLVAVPPSRGWLTGEGGPPRYDPFPDTSGLDYLVYYVLDGHGARRVLTSLQVWPANDSPWVWDRDLRMELGTPIPVTLEGWDPEGAPLSFEIVDPPCRGILEGEGAEWTYTPGTGFAGLDSFRYFARDDLGVSPTATVWLWVDVAGGAPAALEIDVVTRQDAAVVVEFRGRDLQQQPLSYELLTLPQHGSLLGEGSSRMYVPQPGYHGTDEFQYRVSNGLVNSEPATVQIAVTQVNAPPTVHDGSWEVVEGIARSFVLAGEDPDRDTLTFRVTQAPMHGLLSGSLPEARYEPAPGFVGSDRFEFVASDGALDSPAGLVSIEVRPRTDFETTITARREEGQLWLSWPAVPNARYRLWSRADLFLGEWRLLREIPAVDPGQETVVASLPGSEGYYRCEVVPY